VGLCIHSRLHFSISPRIDPAQGIYVLSDLRPADTDTNYKGIEATGQREVLAINGTAEITAGDRLLVYNGAAPSEGMSQKKAYFTLQYTA
jgi:hypothetical protein